MDMRDVIAALRSKTLIRGRELEIRCDSVNAIAYQDVLEGFLFASGVTQWTWIDSAGCVLQRQPLRRILLNLFRDALVWPAIYLRQSAIIARHRKAFLPQRALQTDPSVLFLRTDHWFHLKSGGSVGHIRGVIHGLRASGYQTHVVSTDHLCGVEEDEYFHLCQPAYELGRNLPNVPELLYNDLLARFIGERWEGWSPSFIYQRYSLGNYTGVVLKRKYGVLYVCEYNGSFPWMARNWGGGKLFHERLMARVELLNLHAADLVVVVSRPMKDELVAQGIQDSKILVNPNGVNPEQYSPGVDGSRVRHRYHLDGKTVIGFIGTFGKWHGAEVLAEAFGRLLQDFPVYRERVRLFLIGDGPTMPQVTATLTKFGVTEACTLTGLIPQDEGPAYLAACNILASPHVPNPDGTPFFGSPTKLFEYMAMGKGIVASNLDQIGEIMKHDRTAWLVKPGDAEAMKLGLKLLIDDEQRRKRLGQSARRDVVASYTWREHTRRIIEKLKECYG
ncbi:MAG: glycosyltransferase family 4 protein [Candidatus Latescibacteria bacterium]|nr:glycosyltransferase family 4 protein [Candidatus Latescibacterota bacterium]